MAYKPYRQNTVAYEKNKKSKNYNDGNIKLFGFRSGLAYKMIPAIFYYAFALFYIGSGIYGEIRYLSFTPIDVVLMIFKYIFWILIFFSPAIFLSDFKYRDSLPFFKKRETGSTLIGLILVWMFCYFMANVNIYCMSDTYKESLNEHQKWLEEQRENQSDLEESDTIDVSETVSYNTVKGIVYI
jgi:hypothetical protein